MNLLQPTIQHSSLLTNPFAIISKCTICNSPGLHRKSLCMKPHSSLGLLSQKERFLWFLPDSRKCWLMEHFWESQSPIGQIQSRRSRTQLVSIIYLLWTHTVDVYISWWQPSPLVNFLFRCGWAKQTDGRSWAWTHTRTRFTSATISSWGKWWTEKWSVRSRAEQST